MIANYGYMDGSGEYFITIDTDKCSLCANKPCIDACPHHVFEILEDDYGNEVAAVKKEVINSIKYECSDCKPTINRLPLPCVISCPFKAINHSW